MKSRVFAILPLLFTFCALPARASTPEEAEAEAKAYLDTWEERGREACEDNERGCAAAGHALVRAADAYERAGRLDKAMAIRKMILDPKWHLDYTDYGRGATFALVRNHQSIVEFDEAATLAETAARRFAKSDEAPEALKEAFALRVGLGQLEKAAEDLESFQKFYGSKRPRDVASMLFALAQATAEKERFAEVVGQLEKSMAMIDRQGTFAESLRAHALLARTYAHEGEAKKAAVEYEIVRAGWKDPDAALQRLAELGGTDEEKMRRAGHVLTVVGEAQFFFAEQKRVEVEAVRFPEYQGSGNKESVVKFVGTRVTEWLKKKRTAVEEAEEAYRKVLDLQPMPPPRWVIASASRVGQLWASFAGDFRRAPVPREWQSKAPLPGTTIPGTDIKKMYLEIISSALEPYMQRAKAAFEMCVSFSVKYQWADEYSKSCVGWLGKNHRQKWVPVEEFMPMPRHSGMPNPMVAVLPKP